MVGKQTENLESVWTSSDRPEGHFFTCTLKMWGLTAQGTSRRRNDAMVFALQDLSEQLSRRWAP